MKTILRIITTIFLAIGILALIVIAGLGMMVPGLNIVLIIVAVVLVVTGVAGKIAGKLIK